jgi:heme ABC exporter ATP-binding subunit CcmA
VSSSAVVAQGVSKRFGAAAALRNVDLNLNNGELLLLAGANGAGKTTLLRLFAGLSRPSQGTVLLAGTNPVGSDRRGVGFVSHQSLLYDELTVVENLTFFARLYGVPRAHERIDAMLEWVELGDRRHQRTGTLSRGLKQRLSLARSVLHEPSILLLDEPFASLDRRGIRLITRYLKSLDGVRTKPTAIIVSHEIEPTADVINRVVILRRGRISLDRAWNGGSGVELQKLCDHFSEAETG